MTVELTDDELYLIKSMMSYAEDPCGDASFWNIISEDESAEEYNRLSKIRKNLRKKLK